MPQPPTPAKTEQECVDTKSASAKGVGDMGSVKDDLDFLLFWETKRPICSEENNPLRGWTTSRSSTTRGEEPMRRTLFGKPVDVNLLCLAGALIGVVALLTPWCYAKTSDGRPGFDITTPLHPGSLMDAFAPWGALLFSILAIAGTLISFITPLGGGLQSSSILLLIGRYLDVRQQITVLEVKVIPAYGSLLAVAAAGFILASIVWPEGIGNSKPVSIRTRLLAIRRSSSREDNIPFRSAETMNRFWPGLIVAGFGLTAYCWGMARTFDYFTIHYVALSEFVMLILVGCLGACVSVLGCIISGRHWRQSRGAAA